MFTQQEVIKALMATLDETTLKGTEALDAALKTCSDFDSLQDFKNKIISDCKSVGDSEKFLRDYCGIILGNGDTGAISGSDVGNGFVKTAKSIVPESGDLIKFTGNEFTINGLTVKLAKGGGTSTVRKRSFSSLSAQEKYIWQSLYSYWMKNSLDLISESYGENFSFNENSSATVDTMYLIFEDSYNGILAATWGGPVNAQKSTTPLELHINLKYYGSATGEDGVPNSNQNYLDRTIAHEMTHAVMRSNIDYFDYLPKWLKEGMAELTHGIDDRRSADLRKLAGDSNLLQRTLNDLSATGVSTPSYSGGYLALRYLANQAADTYTKNFSGTDDDEQFETFNNSVTMSGGGGSDTLGNGFYVSSSYGGNGGNKVYLLGGAGDDSLLNCDGNRVTLSGGDGNDTIRNGLYKSASQSVGGGSNVTITGGTGDDLISNYGKNVLIVYESGDGNDSIDGFDETATLSISGDSYYSFASGKNVVVKVGDGKITLTGAASLKTLNIDGTEQSAKVLTNSSAAKITLASGVEVGDASARTKAIRILGNALDNSILGGSKNDTLYGKDGNDFIQGNAGNDTLSGANGDDYLDGGAGNDSLYGGNGDDTLDGSAGNDTLRGGKGDDLFIYSAGNDLITDMSATDTLQIGDGTASYSKATSGKNFVLTVGDGSITLTGAANLKTLNIFGKDSAFLELDDDSAAKITLKSGVEVGDASARTKAIRIIGNALDNSILGGSGKDSLYGKDGDDYLDGGSGNDILSGANGDDYLFGGAGNDSLSGGNGDDTLWGGKGNDTLTGGAGVDTFIYNSGEGKDVITSFANNDLLQITGTFSGTYNSSKNTIAFKVGSTTNALTLKKFTAETFNINSDDYIISGSKLVKK